MRHLKMYEKYLTNNDNIVEYLNSKLDKYIIDVHFSEIDIYEDIKNTKDFELVKYADKFLRSSIDFWMKGE